MSRKIYLCLLSLLFPIHTNQLIAQLPRVDNMPEFQCKIPILSRLENHLIKEGETLIDIANLYGLLPETLIKLNPLLTQNPLSAGQIIKIPPFNGIKVEVPEGATWREMAKAYGVRQDVLFELNGCGKIPKVIFIPGINWYAQPDKPKDYTGLPVYPLPFNAEIGLNYGWHDFPDSQEKFFHSGIDLLAPVNTNVFTAEEGVVVFVGNEGSYGYLIIVNHPGGKQTRYAHLSQVNVRIEDEVKAGELIGNVGTTGTPDLYTPHLHFEIRYQTPQGWVAQDPELHLIYKK